MFIYRQLKRPLMFVVFQRIESFYIYSTCVCLSGYLKNSFQTMLLWYFTVHFSNGKLIPQNFKKNQNLDFCCRKRWASVVQFRTILGLLLYNRFIFQKLTTTIFMHKKLGCTHPKFFIFFPEQKCLQSIMNYNVDC